MPVFDLGADRTVANEIMLASFNRHGAGLYRRAVPPELLARCRAALEYDYPGYQAGARGKDRYEVGDRRFFAEVVVQDCFAERMVLANSRLEPLVRALLGDDYVIEALGVIVALPGAEAQHVHRDGHVLFPMTGLDRVLPAHALTLAMPLVDVSANGTGLWTGSHRLGGANDLCADMDLIAEGPLGTAALWDFRTFHRGLANPETAAPRPLLYITYAREWWIDSHNFAPDGGAKLVVRRATLEALAPDLRQRLARAKIID